MARGAKSMRNALLGGVGIAVIVGAGATVMAQDLELHVLPSPDPVTRPGAVEPDLTAPADATTPPTLRPDDRRLWRLINAGDYPGARAEIDRLRSLFPDYQPPEEAVAILTNPDTRPVWNRINAGDLRGARAEIARLQQEFPGWSPPADMAEALRAGPDTTPVWNLINRGDFVTARQEISRLQSQYPGWGPSRDMIAALEAGPDERPLWELINRQEYDAAEAEIRRLRRTAPGWEPPAAAVQTIAEGRLTARIENAIAARRYGELVSLARSSPASFDCPRSDRIWALTEAYYASRSFEAIEERYRHVITACPTTEERLFALERALQQLPPPAIERLVDLEGPMTRGPVAEQQYQDILRRVFPERFPPPPPRDVALQQQDAGIALGLGWEAFQAGDDLEAERWFQRSLDWSDGGTEPLMGLASLRLRQDRVEEADALLQQVGAPSALSRELTGYVRLAQADRAFETGQYDEAVRLAQQAAQVPQTAEDARTLIGWIRLAQAQEQIETGDVAQARRLAEEAARQPQTNEPARELIGWTTLSQANELFEQGRYDDAIAFARTAAQVDAVAPEAQALVGWINLTRANEAYESGNYAQSIQFANAAGVSPESMADARTIAGWSHYAVARDAYLAGNYPRAIEFATAALSTPEVASDAESLLAWSHYRAGSYAQAAEIFERRYEQTGAQDDAEGLYFALAGLEETGQQRRIARDEGGPFSTLVRSNLDEEAAAASYRRRQFAAVEHFEPAQLEGTRNFSRISPHGHVIGRWRSGEGGEDRLGQISGGVGVRFGVGRSLIEADVTAIRLSAGTPSPGDEVGDPRATAYVRSPTDDMFGFEPRLRWTYETPLQPYLEIGTTPLLGGEVDATWTGRGGLIYHGDTGFRAQADLFRESRRDTLLSYTGLVDPTQNGVTYGRVLEQGATVNVSVPVADRWAVGGEALVSWLDGELTEENHRIAVGINAGYDLRLDGFDYFIVGPSYRYETYDNNQNHFSVGHGGYFSPQQYHVLGLYALFQSEEQAPWIWRGYVSPNLSYVEQDEADILPLTPTGTRYGAEDSFGLGAAGEVEAVYLADENLQLGGLLRADVNANYQEVAGGVFLRYIFGPRSSAVGADLSPSPFLRIDRAQMPVPR